MDVSLTTHIYISFFVFIGVNFVSNLIRDFITVKELRKGFSEKGVKIVVILALSILILVTLLGVYFFRKVNLKTLIYIFLGIIVYFILLMQWIIFKISKDELSEKFERKLGFILLGVLIFIGAAALFVFRDVDSGYMVGVMYFIQCIYPLIFACNSVQRN